MLMRAEAVVSIRQVSLPAQKVAFFANNYGWGRGLDHTVGTHEGQQVVRARVRAAEKAPDGDDYYSILSSNVLPSRGG